MTATCQAEGFPATGTTKLKVPMTYVYTHDYNYYPTIGSDVIHLKSV